MMRSRRHFLSAAGTVGDVALAAMEDAHACFREADESGRGKSLQRLPGGAIEDLRLQRRRGKPRLLGGDERRLGIEDQDETFGPELGMQKPRAMTRSDVFNERFLGRKGLDLDPFAAVQRGLHALDQRGAARRYDDLREILRSVEHAISQRPFMREKMQDG